MSDLHDFVVTRTMTATWTVTVTAESENAAEALAESLPEPTLCYHCATPDVDTERAQDSDLSLDGVWEVTAVDDEGEHDCGADEDDPCEHGPEQE